MEDLAYNIQISNKESFPDFSHGRVLYSALAEYLFNQSDLSGFTIVETGTAKGFSAVCMAKAFEDAGAIGGILTYDVIPHNIEMYWNCVTDHLHGALSRKRLLEKWSDLVDKYVIFVEGDSKLMMNKIHVGRVHFAFLDGGHTYKDVCKEFSWVQEKQFRGDIIICDDYNIVDYPGIVFAVDERCEIGNYRKTVVPLTGNRKLVLCEKL